MSLPPDPMAVLRDRLLAVRDDLRQSLATADHLDAGYLRILADAAIVLQAFDAEATRLLLLPT
jgi:hypothetical protein